jgi:hypothetical protein
MPDLRWAEVEDLFDPDQMGALPDVYVTDASVADWQAVFDLVRSAGWAWEHPTGSLPAAAELFPRRSDAAVGGLRVWPVPGVLAIFRPMSEELVEFDVDLRELQGQAGVDTLCSFLREIGRHLGKPVTMTAEGQYGYPVLGFDPGADRVVLLDQSVRNVRNGRRVAPRG